MADEMRELPGGEGLPEGFAELPEEVYAGDPRWIPEDPRALAAAFSAANPWFGSGRARLWCLPGRSRLAAFVSPAVRDGGELAAAFGYWESRGSLEDDGALFARAAAWAAAEGARSLHGPIDFSTFGRYRLLLASEPGALPFPGEPYNPPGYPARLEALGLRLAQEYVSFAYEPGARERLRARDGASRDALLAEGFRLEPLPMKLWLARLPEIHGMVDAVFGHNWGYTPVPYGAFAAACGEALARKACPDASVIAFAPDGSIAGFFVTMPHYGALVVAGAGEARVAPDALDHAVHAARLAGAGPVTSLGKTIGVHPAHRRRGLMDAMALCWHEWGAARYGRFIGVLVHAGNWSRTGSTGVARDVTRYGLFRMNLPA